MHHFEYTRKIGLRAFLMLSVTVLLLLTHALAASNSFSYTVIGSEARITGCTIGDPSVVIPEELDGYPVTEIGSQAFFGCDDMTELILPNGLAYINDWAFAACGGIKEVVIPATVKEIGESAFAMCTELETVTLRSRSTNISDSAFDLTGASIEYDIPDNDAGYNEPKSVLSIREYDMDFEVFGSSYYAGNSTPVTPDRAVDGDPYTSWDTDGEYEGSWIELNVVDGDKYLIKGFTINNGKYRGADGNDSYFYKNSRVKTCNIYIDDVYAGTYTLQDKQSSQRITLNAPMEGSHFLLEVESVYQGNLYPSKFYGVVITELSLW